jgi:hypothetical protein
VYISGSSIFALKLLRDTVHGHHHNWLSWYRNDLLGKPDRGMSTTPQMRLPPPASIFDDLAASGLVTREEQAPRRDGPPLTRWIVRVALSERGVVVGGMIDDLPADADGGVTVDPVAVEHRLAGTSESTDS